MRTAVPVGSRKVRTLVCRVVLSAHAVDTLSRCGARDVAFCTPARSPCGAREIPKCESA